MNCERCSESLPSNSQYCYNCGLKLEQKNDEEILHNSNIVLSGRSDNTGYSENNNQKLNYSLLKTVHDQKMILTIGTLALALLCFFYFSESWKINKTITKEDTVNSVQINLTEQLQSKNLDDVSKLAREILRAADPQKINQLGESIANTNLPKEARLEIVKAFGEQNIFLPIFFEFIKENKLSGDIYHAIMSVADGINNIGNLIRQYKQLEIDIDNQIIIITDVLEKKDYSEHKDDFITDIFRKHKRLQAYVVGPIANENNAFQIYLNPQDPTSIGALYTNRVFYSAGWVYDIPVEQKDSRNYYVNGFNVKAAVFVEISNYKELQKAADNELKLLRTLNSKLTETLKEYWSYVKQKDAIISQIVFAIKEQDNKKDKVVLTSAIWNSQANQQQHSEEIKYVISQPLNSKLEQTLKWLKDLEDKEKSGDKPNYLEGDKKYAAHLYDAINKENSGDLLAAKMSYLNTLESKRWEISNFDNYYDLGRVQAKLGHYKEMMLSFRLYVDNARKVLKNKGKGAYSLSQEALTEMQARVDICSKIIGFKERIYIIDGLK